jgi:hypothetical protein
MFKRKFYVVWKTQTAAIYDENGRFFRLTDTALTYMRENGYRSPDSKWNTGAWGGDQAHLEENKGLQ